MKRCGTCDSIKPFSEFHVNRAKSSGLATECKVCVRHRTAEWTAANPDRVKAYRKAYYLETKVQQCARAKTWREQNLPRAKASAAAWRGKNKDALKAAKRKSTTGFTTEIFNQFWEAQKGLCGICKKDLATVPSKQVHADHDHVSGLARGILCHHCNVALGYFKDSVSLLAAAGAYLKHGGIKC